MQMPTSIKFLACLYKCKRRAIALPLVLVGCISISKMVKCLRFLCDGQGADRQAIMSGERSCLLTCTKYRKRP